MRALLLVLLLAACGPPREILLRAEGVEIAVVADPFSLVVSSPEGPVLATRGEAPLAATIDRYTVGERTIPGWDAYEAKEEPWRAPSRFEVESWDDRSARLVFAGDGHTVTLDLAAEPGRARLAVTAAIDGAPGRLHKLSFRFALGAEERFYGLGERYASVDHRGLSLYTWAEEAGIGQGEAAPAGARNPYPNGPSMTYYPVPFLLSSAGHGLHLATTRRSEVHLGSEDPESWRVAASGDALALVVYPGAPAEVLDRYTADTGRPMRPAPWVFGPRRRVSPNRKVEGVDEWRLLRARGVPTTGIDDAVHLLPHDSHVGREDDLRAWTRTLHAHGFKVMAYNNPYVSATIERARPLYQHGRERGYFVLDERGEPGLTVFVSGELQSVAAIDFTNPEAERWFQDLLSRTLALGYDGWMHDFGEYIERDWSFADGRRGDELHNLYPLMSAKAAHALLERERPNDYLFFVRAGYTGTQAYVPAVWGGDPEATFDETQGLPAALRGGLNLGLSGVPYFGSDISGFKCFTEDPRDKEIYLRWAQLGAVSPIMMDQNACTAVTTRKQKWTLWSDEETTRVYGALARLHTRLLPYFLTLVEDAAARGLPLMRHPWLVTPEDAGVMGIEDGFFLGDALYAWPVVRRGERVKRGYLPRGRYLDLEDRAVYEGGREVEVPAPLAKLPLLLRSGRILPLLDASIETLAPATEPGVVTLEKVADRLDVLVALGPGERAELSLADGTRLFAARDATDRGEGGLTRSATTALATCAGCFASEPTRLRASSELASATELAVEDLVLRAEGGRARRVRWEVFRLP